MLRMSKVRRDQTDPTCDAVFYRERRRNVDGPGSLLVPLGDFDRAWERACVKAELGKMVQVGVRTVRGKEQPVLRYQGLIFHDLRRSGVRQLIRSGVDEHTAMAISGHKTRSVFQRYNIVSLDDLRAATRKLDKHLAVREPEQQEPRAESAQPQLPDTIN
jgi:integrase